MNDSELITAVKQSVTGVHMHVPTEQIVSRSRTIRARRRIPGAAGALAVVAGVAVAALLPASHQPSAQLAAWTVIRQADGTVSVTIRELRDAAGLQRKLRADGVPASVTFTGQGNPACQGYQGSGTQSQRRQLLGSVATVREGSPNVMTIYPAALPPGAGLAIAAAMQNYSGPRDSIELTVSLVQASPRCTGS